MDRMVLIRVQETIAIGDRSSAVVVVVVVEEEEQQKEVVVVVQPCVPAHQYVYCY
jgi:hypothetical protein